MVQIKQLEFTKYCGRQLDDLCLPWNPRNIIVYSTPQRIGDIIINSGMYLALRNRFPQAEIIQYERDVYPTQSLWESHPANVTRITFDDYCFKPNQDKTWFSNNNRQAKNRLNSQKLSRPDLLIDLVRRVPCSVLTSYRLLPNFRYSFLPRYPMINGHSIGSRDLKENLGKCNMWYLSQSIVHPLTQSFIEPNISWGKTGFTEKIFDWLFKNHLIPTEFVVICPTAGHPSKLWTFQGWIKVIEYIKKLSLRPVLLIPPSEMKSFGEMFKRINDVVYFPMNELELNDPTASLELMRQAKLTIGVDSGGVHISATAGCPLVVLTHPRNYIQWLPIAKIGRAVVSDVKQLDLDIESWLRGITSTEVCQAIDQLL